MIRDRIEFEVVFDHWRANVGPIVRKPCVALNDHVELNKLLANLFPRATRSVDMSNADYRQSLTEQHRSFHRLLQCEIVQNQLNQSRDVPVPASWAPA